MAINLFAYGTFLVPNVMHTVCDAVFESVEACAEGYARVQLKNKVYPAMLEDKDSMVDGQLYMNVDDRSVKRLDYFEGKEYIKKTIQVELPNRKKMDALAYIISPDSVSLLTKTPWNFAEFKAKHLSDYMKNVRQQMRDFR